MFKSIIALAFLLPQLALAGGPFAVNYGTYKILARHSRLSPDEDFARGVAYLRISEQGEGTQRAIILTRFDAKMHLRGGGPLLTTAEITGDKSLRCVEREHIIQCTMASAWFTTTMTPLADGRYVLTEFNAGERQPETIWELKKVAGGDR